MSKDLALRYPQFITLFEKEVTAMQARIDAMRQLERVHNVMNPILRKANLPNDCTVNLAGNRIELCFQALPDDRLADFEKLCTDIGQGFKTAEFHKDGAPAKNRGGWAQEASWVWYLRLDGGVFRPVVHIALSIGDPGLIDFEWVKQTVSSSYTRYELVSRVAAERKSF